MILTVEQSKLVEDNHDLIYWYLTHHKYNFDDYYDLLAIGLCKAACSYDESKGKFSTYATKCMQNECNEEWRKKNLQGSLPEDKVISLDTVLHVYDNGAELTLQDTLADPTAIEDEVVTKIVTENVMSLFSQRECKIIKLLLEGRSMREVAEAEGCSRQYVGKIAQKFYERVKLNCKAGK